jgi:hypothetical protein
MRAIVPAAGAMGAGGVTAGPACPGGGVRTR